MEAEKHLVWQQGGKNHNIRFTTDQLLLGMTMVQAGNEWRPHLITLEENRGDLGKTPSREALNLACIGMPGSGKSRLLEAQLMNWGHSVAVVDLKGSLYKSTASYRAQLGPVYVLDVRNGSGNRFNPVAQVRRSSRRALAIELVSQGEQVSGSERFWTNAAVNAWLACWYAADDVQRPHIPYSVELLSLTLPEWLAYMHKHHSNNPRVMRLVQGFTGEPLTPKFLARLIEEGPSKLLGNKWGSVEESVTVFSEDDAMLRIFSGDDLDLPRMFKRPATIYIIADENNTQVFQAFVRLCMKAIGEKLIEAGDVLNFNQRRPILFLFDEFGAAKINNARTWLNTMRSRGIILWIFAQSVSQLPSETRRDYDPARENSIHHWVVFAPSYGDSETGQFISKLSGTVTVEVKAGEGMSYRADDPTQRNMSQNIAYRERPNVRPEDADDWQMNQAAVSIRPNGRARQFYGPVSIASTELLLLDERKGPAAEYQPLPAYESVLLPLVDVEELAEQSHEERPGRSHERGRDTERRRYRDELEEDDDE